MTIKAASGTRIYIGGATSDLDEELATFQAESWVLIGEVESIGEFGDASESVPFTSLGDSRVRKLKGPRDAGTCPLVVGDDPSDAGQTALVAAEATPFDYRFKVVGNDAATLGGDGSESYFAAQVMGKKKNVGAANNVVRRTFDLGINTDILEVAPT
jgi:hypothetical protein